MTQDTNLALMPRNEVEELREKLRLARIEIAELKELSWRDPLTGCLNRRGLEEQIALGLATVDRTRSPLFDPIEVSILYIDLDHFKKMNDWAGHETGDKILRDFSQALSSTFSRSSDLICRRGGDEFSVVLIGSTLEVATVLAEKLQEDTRSLIGTSIGIASTAIERFPRRASAGSRERYTRRMKTRIEACMAAADKFMYEAKEAGRMTIRSAAMKK